MRFLGKGFKRFTGLQYFERRARYVGRQLGVPHPGAINVFLLENEWYAAKYRLSKRSAPAAMTTYDMA